MKQKINWLLILQAWAMLWVVIGHSPMTLSKMPWYEQITYNFAYSFHMPLFMTISGYLFCMTRLVPRNDDGKVKWLWNTMMQDKLIRLGIPFIVFSVIAMILKSMFPGDMARPACISVMTLLQAIVYPGRGPLGELWFVGVLFWMFALLPFWRWGFRNRNCAFIIFGGLLLVHFFNWKIDLLCLGAALNYAIWFLGGMVVYKYVAKPEKWGGRFSFIIGTVIYIVSCMFKIRFIMSVSAILASYGMALILNQYMPRLFSTFRNYTYQIFLMGIFAQIAVKIIVRRLVIPEYMAFIACIIAGVYFPVVISVIVQAINNKWLCLCIGLKKKV